MISMNIFPVFVWLSSKFVSHEICTRFKLSLYLHVVLISSYQMKQFMKYLRLNVGKYYDLDEHIPGLRLDSIYIDF